MSNNDGPRREDQYRADGSYDDGGKKPLLKRILLWIAGAIVLLFVAGCALFFYYASSAPKISQRELSSQNTTIIYDANNKVISRLGAQKRDYAKDSQIPDTLKHAVVAIEDRRFYKHHGVDVRRIFGAAINNVIGRSDGMQGGSTLTQQLVKLSVFSTAQSDRTFKRKAQEAWLALNVERHFSKDQILKYYINKVYMGNGVYGMRTAAQYYYGKELKDLDLSQLALLAGMPQSPTNYNPLASNIKYATARRNEVLNAMVRAGYITKSAAQNAASESVTDGLDPIMVTLNQVRLTLRKRSLIRTSRKFSLNYKQKDTIQTLTACWSTPTWIWVLKRSYTTLQIAKFPSKTTKCKLGQPLPIRITVK